MNLPGHATLRSSMVKAQHPIAVGVERVAVRVFMPPTEIIDHQFFVR